MITEPSSLPSWSRSRRGPHDFNQTIVHELVHAHVDYAKEADGDHGPKFRAALKSVMDYYAAMPASGRADVAARASWLIAPQEPAAANEAALTAGQNKREE